MIEYNKKDESVGYFKDWVSVQDDITGEYIQDDYYYNVDSLDISKDTLLQLHEEEVVVVIDDNYVEYCYMLDGEIVDEKDILKYYENEKVEVGDLL